MLDESDAVAALQNRLTLYRRTIELLEMQRAQFGAFTPAYIWHQFDDARSAIARIKGELRALGVSVEDHADDAAGQPAPSTISYRSTDSQTLLSIYRRMLVDQVRYVPLAGLGIWQDVTLSLADLYVEPTLALPGSAPPIEQQHTLGSLLAPSDARVLIEGQPGSGRTTCLHMLALACAAPAGPASALIADWHDPPPLPILLNARDITAALARGNAVPTDQDLPTPAAFWAAIERWLKYSELDPLVPTIQQMLDRGGCLVLLDDLDDFPETPSRMAYVTALARFVARYPDNRYIITCRDDASYTAPLASFRRCQLAPLTQAQIDTFAARWYTAIASYGTFVAGDLPERIAMLQGALNGDEQLRALAANARALALCVLTHAEGHELPAERALVLRRLADLLLSGWDQSRGDHRPATHIDHSDAGNSERHLGLLEALALEFQSRLDPAGEQPPVMRYAEIKAILSESRSTASIERRRAGADLVPDLLRWCGRTGLLAPVGPGAYTMPHQQLREYLAARALASSPDIVMRAYGLRHETRWQPILLLTARELHRSGMPNRVHELLRLLLQPPNTSQGERERDLLLAAACLIEIGDQTAAEHALRAGARERLVRLMEEPTTPIEQRIQAGMLLGQLGDSRFVGLLPPLASVPAGPFMLGSDEGYPDEGPRQWVDVPAFSIGVYPVTVQQYAAFLADSPAQLPPRYWYDPRYNNPACPVVGVTWHDAVAYCTWLTARLARVGLLPEGVVVRLPLEVEWEKAASWDEQLQVSRRYPWSDEWDSSRANTADGRGAWMTAPVGCFPEGVSPYGMHESIGNVWEWTASEYASYPGAAPFHEAGRYALRGSSCASNPTHTRCTYRSRLPANYWRYHLGFRIVLGPSIA